MEDVGTRWQRLWSWMQGSPTRRIHSLAVAPASDAERHLAERFEPGEHYFSIYVHEMFLTMSRQWAATYEPMAFTVTEFQRGGTKVNVPFVVGPAMLKGKIQEIPDGIAITDTQVAGPSAFRGGSLSFTIVLAQVKKDSYARKLLEVVEQISRAFPGATALDPTIKVASAVLDGIESLFGMGDTQPLIGHRWEYNAGTTQWMQPGYSALIDADVDTLAAARLKVQRGRLMDGTTSAQQSYRSANYVLYSLQALDSRDDYEQLPFHDDFMVALAEAGTSGDDAWERARAALASALRKMLTSPDLNRQQALSLYADYKARLLEARKLIDEFETLTLSDAPAPVAAVKEGAPPSRYAIGHEDRDLVTAVLNLSKPNVT